MKLVEFSKILKEEGNYTSQQQDQSHCFNGLSRESLEIVEDNLKPQTGKTRPKQSWNWEIPRKRSIVNSVVSCSACQGASLMKSKYEIISSQPDKPENIGSNFSAEVADAIETIDSGISVLQLWVGSNSPIKVTMSSCNHGFCSAVPTMQEKRERIEKTRLVLKQLLKDTDSPSLPPSQMCRNRKVSESSWSRIARSKQNVDRTELQSQLSSKNVCGFRVPLNQDENKLQIPKTEMKMQSKIKEGRVVHDPERKGKLVKSMAQSQSKILRPTLIDYESSSLYHGSHRRSIATRRPFHGSSRQYNILPYKEEPEDIATGSSESVSSRSWTSQDQQTTTTTTTTNTNSTASSDLSSRNTSGTMPESEKNSISSYTKASSYKDISLTRRRSGGLKKLKNKLGLIFHHHHHHHHHHHQHHRRSISLWKQLQNKFHHKQKQKVTEKEAATQKARKALVSNKHRVGHFHALVKGLMRHVNHSKPSRGGGGGEKGNVHHRSDKRSWKMVPTRRRVKLPTKGRIRLGFLSKKQKPRLKAPNKMI
ncbi:hypothetical protein K2173_000934 [Erythroxylum novogranatense]|uniref:Uncharacterized protein n=1 Tax=Erythroxylum novogranatense TaxID=1862640 RepID=A0AAV8TSW0_9ROSI|nr:hypothetical protein K2173_000934 [Erythroxylum novogranatense]